MLHLGSSRECSDGFWFIWYYHHLVERLGETKETSVLVASQCIRKPCWGHTWGDQGVKWPLHLEIPGPHTGMKYYFFFLGSCMKILLGGPQQKRKKGNGGVSEWNSKLSVLMNGSWLTFLMPYSIWIIPLDNQTEEQLNNCSTIECEMSLKRLDFLCRCIIWKL